MKISCLPLIAIVALVPSATFAQQLNLQPAATVNSSVDQPATHDGISLGNTIAPTESSIVTTNEWVETGGSYVPPTQAYWPHGTPFTRSRTLAPMVTRAPIMASPVIAAPMIMSVKRPERYNYSSPRGYSPARGGFIFGRSGRR